MKEKQPLSNLLKKYSTGLLSRKEFEGRIFQYILDNHPRFRLYDWTREQCSDYLSWLYPRLSKAIDLYREQGASFDAYIGSMVYWTSREYRSRQVTHHITEYVCWKARAEEMAVYNHEPDYLGQKAPRLTPGFQQIFNPRQILMLLLKSYYFISDEFLARIVPAIGMDLEQVRLLIWELRDRRLKREEEIRGLRERLHCQYYRCISFEKRVNTAPEGSALRIRMEERLVRGQARLASMKRRLAKIRVEPSNRQIAEVLGVPKGTVDSGLHALRAKYLPDPEPAPCQALSQKI